jgi:protein phosphatase
MLRVLIISDIHGNADALKAVLESARRFDAIWVIGDLVDYGPEPHIVVDIIRELKPEVIVMGNHDYAVAYNTDCKCHQILHDLSVYTRLNISIKLLTHEQVNWLKTLKHNVKLKLSNKCIYIVHGAPRDPLYGYLKPDLPIRDLEELLTEPASKYSLRTKLVDADHVILGHTHISFTLEVKGINVLNPGSVGQPRDGDPRASYAIFDLETYNFTHYRVKYNVERVIDKLKALKLEYNVIKRLEEIIRTGNVI